MVTEPEREGMNNKLNMNPEVLNCFYSIVNSIRSVLSDQKGANFESEQYQHLHYITETEIVRSSCAIDLKKTWRRKEGGN